MTDKKLIEANQIIVEYIKENYKETNWRYVDFVDADRFFAEITIDKDCDCDNWDAEGIAEYCLEKIGSVGALEMGQMNREF